MRLRKESACFLLSAWLFPTRIKRLTPNDLSQVALALNRTSASKLICGATLSLLAVAFAAEANAQQSTPGSAYAPQVLNHPRTTTRPPMFKRRQIYEAPAPK